MLFSEKNVGDYHPLQTVIADVPQNFERAVRIDFPRQYVRYMRFKRNISVNDLQSSGTSGPEVQVQQGTIGEFVLLGAGIPKRVFYTTRITDLGQELNFGRLFWNATPMRVVNGQHIAVPDAERLECGRPTVTAFQELRVGESPVAVNDRLTLTIQPARAAGEFDRCQSDFHGATLAQYGAERSTGRYRPDTG